MAKGGKSTFSENIQAAKEVIQSIINLLEPEFAKLGDAETMTRSQQEQLSQEVNRKIDRLDELMAPVRRNGVKPDDEYNAMYARAGELIERLDTYSGGKRRKTRRRKTRRSKTVRKK
jgi:ElaB/YqjD/DUF883 family membrane-anchored ribosome-binding protein